MVNEGEYIG